jgi:hypothetical protein
MISHQEILKAIDASIIKWKRIVWPVIYYPSTQRKLQRLITGIESACPLCKLFTEDCVHPDSNINCPIYEFTGEDFCWATSFYSTTHWAKYLKNPRYTGSTQANNQMLSELYEIRRKFIAAINKGAFDEN